MPLTDAACRAAKPKEKLYKISDGGGLQLWVHPSGSRHWRVAYRFAGRQMTKTIGPYPDVKLAEARELLTDYKRKLRAGVDPGRDETKSSEYHPFEKYANEWFESAKTGWSEGHAFRTKQRMDRDILPAIGKTDVRQVSPTVCLETLRKVEARGAIDMTKRVRQTISSIMRYCVAVGLVEHDPTANIQSALKRPPKVKHHSFVREDGVPNLIKTISDYDGEPVTRLALLFTLRTIVRSSETRFAKWEEFENLDGEKPLWRIPAERMKARIEHLVPLTPQVVEILHQVRQFPRYDNYVFPGKSKRGTMSENTMIFALYRMGFHSKMTVHGFRSTASTMLNESDLFKSDWIEKQLSHVEQDEIRAAYNAAEWLEPRRKMMIWWNDKLDELTPK